MFLFHNPELGEYLRASSFGLPDDPKSFLVSESFGDKCLRLLTGRLPGAEKSYFFGRWLGHRINAIDGTPEQLSKGNHSVDISLLVVTSLRATATYRDQVPNPNVAIPLPIQQRLIRLGQPSLLREDGDSVPIDSLATLYALAGQDMPLSYESRHARASDLFMALARVLTGAKGVATACTWKEERGDKLVRKQGHMSTQKDGVRKVCTYLITEAAEQDISLVLDAEVGTSLKKLRALLGDENRRHCRKVNCLSWG